MTNAPTIVFVEHVLWQPGAEWHAALEHVADRFARVSPFDVVAIEALGPLHLQLDALDAWAVLAGADLDRELGRWLDEHLSMHVRPNPAVTRAVRALASHGPVHVASSLPARAGEAIARHAGCWRSVALLHAEIRDAAALASLMTEVGADRVFAAAPTPIPDDVNAEALLVDRGSRMA